MFRNLLNQGGGGRGLFGGKQEPSGDKPPSLPEHLQMSIDIASSMQSIVSMLAAEGEPGSKIQEEMEPLHRELVNLLQACIEVNKENDRRHAKELDSSKFVMDQVQSQLITTKKDLTDTTMNLQKTKEELQQTKQELQQTKQELKEAKTAAESAIPQQIALGQQQPSLQSATESADVQLMQNQVESLQHKLEHRQSRIDNLQHILSMKEREHETELTRHKAKAMLSGGGGAPASDDEDFQNLIYELDETKEELEQVRDELEQQTELMIEAEDKLKEADQAIQNKTQMEDRMDHLSERLHHKTQEVNEIENELEQMHLMMEQTKSIMNEQSRELEEKEMQLNALKGSQVAKPAVDDGVVASLREKLEQTQDELKDREDDIKKLKDDLQNTKEIMDIQAQVLQEQKNNPPPPPPPPPAQSFDNEEEDGLRISIEEHMETVHELQQQLEDARDKIASQSNQINEQHQKMNDVMAAPWREENSDEPSMEEMKQELDIATERNQRLEKQIEEIEDQLEETMREFEQQAALIQSKDEQIRSLENAEDQLAAEVEQIRDDVKSTNSSLANDLEDKERIIESLEMQLLEADEAIQELQKQHAVQRKSMATTNDTAREERETFISSLEMQLEDADTAIRKLETRVREKDKEIKQLEADVRESRQLLEEARQAKEDGVSREVDPKEELEEKDAEIERLAKKLKDVQEKASRSRELDQEVEEKDTEIARLEKKLKDLQEKASRSRELDHEVEEKDAEIARLEKKLKDVQERAMSEEEFAEVQKALLHANKSMKKGQKQITKLTEQLEGTEKAMERELANAQKLIDEKDATIRSLELKVEGAEASLAMSQEELHAQAKELEKVKKAMQGMQQETRSGSEESESTMKALREEVASSNKEIGELREELTKKNSDSSPTNAADNRFGEDEAPKKRVSAFGESTEAMTYQELKDRLEVLEQQKLASAAEAEKKELAMNSLQKELDSAKEEAQNLVALRKELENAQKDITSADGSGAVKSLPVDGDKPKAMQASLEQKEKELDQLRVEKQTLEEKLKAMVSNANTDKSQDKSIQSLEKEIGLHEKDALIASLEKELQALTVSGKQTKQGSGESKSIVTKELETESEIGSGVEKKLPPGDTQAMQQELVLAQKTISDLQQEIGDLEGNMKQALSALVKEKDNEIKRLSNEFDNAAKVVVEKEAEIARLKNQLEENERTMAVVVRSRKDQSDELEKMKGRLSGLESELVQAKEDEETRIQELNGTIQTLTQQLEESEESIRTLQRKGQQTKRQSMKDRDDTQAEMEKLKAKIKTLETEVNKKNQDRIRIKELESQLEREVEQSIEVGRKKQFEIDVLTGDLQNANTRIEDLGEMIRIEREKRARKVSKDEHRIIDLADRLEQEIDHSESLKKQLDTYKHSLKAKRKIIDSQAHELRDCQDKLDMHDSITRKAKRKMKQLENEIWNLEGELESINIYLRGQQRGGFGGGRDPRGMQGPYIDDVPVTQYLDHFSKKVISARRQLEAAQDRMYRGR